jgi:hypothetical protein
VGVGRGRNRLVDRAQRRPLDPVRVGQVDPLSGSGFSHRLFAEVAIWHG